MSKELHYYNKYKCPVCGCEHIVISRTKEFRYKDEENLCIPMWIIKCTNPDCQTELRAPAGKFGDSKLYNLWLKEEPKPEKIQYPFVDSSYILDEFLMKACNLNKVVEENAALKEALKILRPCVELEEETVYASDPFGGLTPKPYLTVKRCHTIKHGFCKSDIEILEAAFEILDKEEQK